MEIVVLDGGLTNPGDLSWSGLEELGRLTVYSNCPQHEIIQQARTADIIVTNKLVFSERIIHHLPRLKCICLLASGYNNIDLMATRKKNIDVCNAVGYGTDSVAQHVMAMILNLTNAVSAHNDSIQAGDWAKKQWSYSLQPLTELAGKNIGIYGFGRIGKRVAQLGLAFKMNVIAHHKYPERDATEGVKFVSLKDLFKLSDFITLHAPLTTENNGIVNWELLHLMKPSAVLINTGRGGLINEADLKLALIESRLGAAALDVLSEEPPRTDHPLIGLKNCILTPHNAWATREARKRLIDIVTENVRSFLSGNPKNIVNY